MASVWRRQPRTPGIGLVQRASPAPTPTINVHSLVAGNGQHYVLPTRTGGQPHIGHKGGATMSHPFGPSETFAVGAGGVNMPAPTRLRATTPAAINSITGQAAGTYQLAPGGGFNMPAAQTRPGSVGR